MTRWMGAMTLGAAGFTLWAVTAPFLAWPHATADIIASGQPMLLLEELFAQTDWIGARQTKTAWGAVALLLWCVVGLVAQHCVRWLPEADPSEVQG
jgi:hypothetical protein